MATSIGKEIPVKAAKATEREVFVSIRNSKDQRLRFLTDWCMRNPLATIEQARAALKEEFAGVAMGTKVIADTLRAARQYAEAQYKAHQPKGAAVLFPVPSPDQSAGGLSLQSPPVTPIPAIMNPIQAQIQTWAQAMRAAGIRSVTVEDDGRVNVEFRS